MAITFNADTTNGAVITSDTSGEIELQANGVTKAKVTANGLQDANGNSLRGGMYRNLIINGDMRIAQRGTSTTGTTGDGYYTVDRFHVVNRIAGTWTQTQDTDVPSGQGFVSSLKMQCTTANASLSASDQLRLEQRIEAQMLQHLKFGTANAETLTLSFWVKSNKTGTYTAWLYALDDVRSISKAYTINTADTWEKKKITIEGDSVAVIDNDNDLGLFCTFSLGAGSNYTSGTFNTSWNSHVTANMISPSQVNLADSTSNYINITGVQLEVGEGASDFEFLPYDVQLQRCQRYYYKIKGTGGGCIFATGWNVSTTSASYSITLPVTMRTYPTALETSGTASHYQIVHTNTANACNGVPTYGGETSPEMARVDTTVASGLTAGQGSGIRASNIAAYLAWSAEL
jgi:hypothetical protein